MWEEMEMQEEGVGKEGVEGEHTGPVSCAGGGKHGERSRGMGN